MVLLPMISSILTSDDLVVIQHDLQDALVQEAGVGPAMEQGLNGWRNRQAQPEEYPSLSDDSAQVPEYRLELVSAFSLLKQKSFGSLL